jgi:hypothetical protein
MMLDDRRPDTASVWLHAAFIDLSIVDVESASAFTVT